MIEIALRYEVKQALPELIGEIYPTNAPETCTKPYLVYMRAKTDRVKVLDGYTNKQALKYMFNVMATKYADMIRIRGAIENLILNMPKRYIGETNKIYVEDIEIEDIRETYEFNLSVNRGIIFFTIYF